MAEKIGGLWRRATSCSGTGRTQPIDSIIEKNRVDSCMI